MCMCKLHLTDDSHTTTATALVLINSGTQTSGPFVGCRSGQPSLPRNYEAEGKKLWETCEELVVAAESGKLLKK
jgi:hypothetical protein